MIDVAYRIVEIKDGKVKPLFHGIRGRREFPLDTWVKADMKMVKDGSSTFTYLSGFHVLRTKQEAEKFFSTMFRIKKDRYIIPCYVLGGFRRKHPKGKKGLRAVSWLVDYIYINSHDIEMVIRESEYKK